MAVDFRCDRCGKLLSVEGDAGSTVRCPHCGRKVAVPSTLASLPRRDVPAGGGLSAAEVEVPQELSEEETSTAQSEEMMAAVARVIPWVISVFLHVGLLLFFALLTMFVIRSGIPEHVVVPEAFLGEDPGGVMTPAEQDLQPEVERPAISPERHHSRRESAIPADTGQADRKIELIGVGSGGAGGGALARFGLEIGGSSAGPRSSFFGSGGNAHHIVYVVDRSGSMLDTFDYVRREILKSVSRLRPPQDFHIILFAEGQPLENPPKRLVVANHQNKLQLAEFLIGVIAERRSDPIPALKRAFGVLRKANRLPGKLIYLLTDGQFTQPPGDVLRAIRAANHRDEVLINTYLYWYEDRQAIELMRQIAEQNGGRYRYISPEE